MSWRGGRRRAEPYQHGHHCQETHPLGWSRQRRRPYGLWGNMFCKKEACFWRKERVSFSLVTPFSGWSRLPRSHCVLCCPDWYSARQCIRWAARVHADRAAQLLQWWEGARAAAVGPGGSEVLREGTEDSREMQSPFTSDWDLNP